MKLKRSRKDHLLVEETVGEQDFSVLLFPGLPQLIQKHNLVRVLDAAGIKVILPQFSGSWDSEGGFDIDSHIEDIKYLMHIYEAAVPIGYSYGAGALMVYLSRIADRKKSVLIAPPLDYQRIEAGSDSFKTYLASNYPHTYRKVSENTWKHLRGGYLNPKVVADSINSEGLLIYGAADSVTNPEDLNLLKNFETLAVDCGHSLEDFSGNKDFCAKLIYFIKKTSNG